MSSRPGVCVAPLLALSLLAPAVGIAQATEMAPPADAPPTSGLIPGTPTPAMTTIEPAERWTEPRPYAAARPGRWDNAALERRPRGSPHFGLQTEGGVAFILSNRRTGPAPTGMFGASAFIDVTLDADQSFRLGVFGQFAGLSAVWVDGPAGGEVYFAGGGSVGVCALFGIDFADRLVFRAGVEGAVVVSDGPIGGSAIGRFEVAGRLLESRNLEIGLALLGGIRTGASEYRGSTLGRQLSLNVVTPAVMVFLSWVFE